MAMAPGGRKLALTLHVTASVGWLGAVAAFLALSIAGLTSEDALRVRAAYLSMETITWTVIVPLSFASLLSGVVQGLGTSWGLFRHYWVVAKLVLNVLATGLLLLHTQPITRVARAAGMQALATGDLRRLRIQLLGDAIAALLALLAATALSVYKPGGLTPYGRRRAGSAPVGEGRPWGSYALIVVLGLLLLIAIVHLAGGGLHGH